MLASYAVIVVLARRRRATAYSWQSEKRGRLGSPNSSRARGSQQLRGQLQPHFLFNTLNAIAELVHVGRRRRGIS